jgi:hypothetical protein
MAYETHTPQINAMVKLAHGRSEAIPERGMAR